MLVEAVSLLLNQLNQYVHQEDGDPAGTAGPAIWGNISQLDHPQIGTGLENQLVLTLVNVEEEKALKNSRATAGEAPGVVLYRNPPLHLNLLLLFTANYRNYETALRRLTQVLTFFQGKRHFTSGTSPGAAGNAAFLAELSFYLVRLSNSFDLIKPLLSFILGK